MVVLKRVSLRNAGHFEMFDPHFTRKNIFCFDYLFDSDMIRTDAHTYRRTDGLLLGNVSNGVRSKSSDVRDFVAYDYQRTGKGGTRETTEGEMRERSGSGNL